MPNPSNSPKTSSLYRVDSFMRSTGLHIESQSAVARFPSGLFLVDSKFFTTVDGQSWRSLGVGICILDRNDHEIKYQKLFRLILCQHLHSICTAVYKCFPHPQGFLTSGLFLTQPRKSPRRISENQYVRDLQESLQKSIFIPKEKAIGSQRSLTFIPTNTGLPGPLGRTLSHLIRTDSLEHFFLLSLNSIAYPASIFLAVPQSTTGQGFATYPGGCPKTRGDKTEQPFGVTRYTDSYFGSPWKPQT